MDKTNMPTKAVKSRRIAWLLRKEGYKIISVEPNRYNPQFDVYIFEDVPGFSEALTKYINEQEKHREEVCRQKLLERFEGK